MPKIAKPFRKTSREKMIVTRRERRMDRVAKKAVAAMEAVMLTAVDRIVDNVGVLDYMATPYLQAMDDVSLAFYRGVIEIAFIDCKETFPGKRKLARLPTGMPRNLKGLENLFRDARYWPKIMKRSEILTNRLRKSYLEKLRKKFAQIIPDLQAGLMSSEEAKKELMKSWNASKSRVETIFRTETTTYFSNTQEAFFAGNENIIGFLFNCERRTTSTKICLSRHGLVYRPGTELLRKNKPACHWNCGSGLIALANTERNRKMLLDPSRDPELRKVEPLPKGWRN